MAVIKPNSVEYILNGGINLNGGKRYLLRYYESEQFSTNTLFSRAINLQWSDLYFDTDRIFVKDRKNFNNGMMPMHQKLKEMFLRRRERSSEGYVFQSTNGTQIQEVSDTYTRVVDSLGFNKGLDDPRQKVVFHTLRHTYASWLVMNGVDLYTVQRMMGHKEISMTQRYAHLAPDILDKAVNVLR